MNLLHLLLRAVLGRKLVGPGADHRPCLLELLLVLDLHTELLLRFDALPEQLQPVCVELIKCFLDAGHFFVSEEEGSGAVGVRRTRPGWA